MYAQKAYKNGNSIVMTIPVEYLNDLGIRDGSPLVVDKKGSEMVVRHEKKKNKGKKNDFYNLLQKVNEQYGEALEELAK